MALLIGCPWEERLSELRLAAFCMNITEFSVVLIATMILWRVSREVYSVSF